MSIRGLWMGIAVALFSVTCALAASVADAEPLPDGRVYELVTRPDNNFGSEAYVPAELGVSLEYEGDQTEFPFQASADGERIAFVGGLTEGGSESAGYDGGNEYLATRLPGGGWKQANITPTDAASSEYEAFSKDLSIGFLEATEPLSSSAPGFGEPIGPNGGNYDVLYSTATGSAEYTPFFTVKPPYRSMLAFKTAPPILQPFFKGGQRAYNVRVLAFAGASADSSHVLFLANDALTGESEGRPAAEGGSSATFEQKNNLYESVDGQLRLVNVLPNGSTHVDATFGGGPLFERAISSDGSRIFWTDLSTGHIYVRENGLSTVEISSAGLYQTASVDGSKAFYTNGELYEYELEGARTSDLTPGVPVSKVVGASENGEYVYFVTVAGELEVWHEGTTVPIAASKVTTGEVTPDGHSIVFADGFEQEQKPVHVYDADTGQLYCITCTATGSGGGLQKTNAENVYQPRWISDDGSRVFFDSNASLVAQDTNGFVDAYEWQRPGSGGCEAIEGCVHVLSGGTSSEESVFIDASESGDDAFFVTTAKLIGTDDNELYDVYDARVQGLAPLTPPACTGTGCQGIPAAPPIFATPSSVTFEGVGNFATQTKEIVKKKVKKKVRHKKRKGRKRSGKSSAKKAARQADGRSHSRGGR